MSLNKADFAQTREPLPKNQYQYTHTSFIRPVPSTLALHPPQLALDPGVSISSFNGLINNAPLGCSMFTNPNMQKLDDPVRSQRSTDSLFNILQTLTDQNNSTPANQLAVDNDASMDLIGINNLFLDE